MNNKVYLLLLITISFFTSCQKKFEAEPLSAVKQITQFKLESTLNAVFLTQTIEGSISEDEIKLIIPLAVDARNLVASFKYEGESLFQVTARQESGITVNDFTKALLYTVVAEDGSKKDYKVSVERLPELPSGIPHLYIQTENEASIKSKDIYLKASLKIEGAGVYEDYEGITSIKGRGNSTWTLPKKPYRLKLDKKAPLLGLSAEKDWILLANYLDGTLMLNAVAFKTGRLLEMPFTNTAIPVDLTINGEYQGNYLFTEQKEVEDNRINIGPEGVLLELDTYFDEPWKFYSGDYKLPVMIQYPELDKIAKSKAEVQFEKIKSDFKILEQAVASSSFPNNNYLEYIDATALVRYLIIYDLALNGEINHPKSTYMYKLKGGKYMMGPIWDFDWGFGFDGVSTSSYFKSPAKPLFWTGTTKGTVFFDRFMKDPAIRSLYKKEWNQFKAQKLPLLHTFIDNYSEVFKDSYYKDYAKWKQGTGNLVLEVQKLHKWFNERSAYLDQYVVGF